MGKSAIKAGSARNLAQIQKYLVAAEKALTGLLTEQGLSGMADKYIRLVVNSRLDQLHKQGLLIAPRHFSGRETHIKDLIRKLRVSQSSGPIVPGVPQPAFNSPVSLEKPSPDAASQQSMQQVILSRRGTRAGKKAKCRELRSTTLIQQHVAGLSNASTSISTSVEQQQSELPQFELSQFELPKPVAPPSIQVKDDHQHTIALYRDTISAQHQVIQSFREMNADLTEKLRKSRLRCSQFQAELFMLDGRITSSEFGDESGDDSSISLP